MKTPEPFVFDKEMAKEFIGALTMSFGETGNLDDQDTITKLYRAFPEILKEENDYDTERRSEHRKDSDERKELLEVYFDIIDFSIPILDQLRSFQESYSTFRGENHKVESELFEHERHFDTITLASSIIHKLINVPVHLEALRVDMVKYLEEKNDDLSEFDLRNLQDNPDEFFHVLNRIFNDDSHAYHDVDKIECWNPCNMCGADRTPNDSFQCDSCKTKREAESEEFWSDEGRAKRDAKSRKEYNDRWAKINSEREAILKEFTQ